MSRAGSREPGKKLDNVWVEECANQLALPHELTRGLGQTSLQDGVDGFGGGGHRESHLVSCAIGPATNIDPSRLNVIENERPQPGMVAEKIFSHFHRRLPKKLNLV